MSEREGLTGYICNGFYVLYNKYPRHLNLDVMSISDIRVEWDKLFIELKNQNKLSLMSPRPLG